MNNKNQNKGFTLIELILSVVILALVAAPFLGSFVVANKTNADSKKIQEASAIGQSVVEDIKSLKFDKIQNKYAPTVVGDAFEISIPNNQLPNTYNSNYTAKVSIKPRVNDEINKKVIPDLADIDKEHSIVYMKDFYTYDVYALPGEYRKNTFSIEYDDAAAKHYEIKHTVEYIDSVNHCTYSKQVSVNNYQKMPDIYMVYTPLSDKDKIEIDNKLSDTQRTTSSGTAKLNVYVAQQENYAASASDNKKLKPDNVTITDYNNYGNPKAIVSLEKLQNDASVTGKKDELMTDSSRIFTNITSGSGDSNLIVNKTDYTMYDMKVEILYNSNVVSTLNTTTTIFK